MFGNWTEKQIPNTYNHYADTAMEVLLVQCKSLLEKHTGLKLVENYSYMRMYKKHDVLFKHKDRPECEISCTMNIGGDEWPIFFKENHWREPFQGENCKQVFLHYSPANKKNIEATKYDGKLFLGLPLQYVKDNSRFD